MRRNSSSIGNSGAYTSPGTPEYGDSYGRGMAKGWSSERIPLPAGSNRSHISVSALMPFNSGRALPSKWDDAERWITSPLSGHGFGVSKNSAQIQNERRPKSKSGPLGTAGVMYLPSYSPVAPALEGGSGRNFMAGSPLMTGVLMPEGLSIHYAAGNGSSSNSGYTNVLAHGNSVPGGYSDFISDSSVPNSQDDRLDSCKEEDSNISRAVSRRDMATQMSPENSNHSSPKRRSSSFSGTSLPIPTAAEQYNNVSNNPSTKADVVRDVQVDKDATVTRQSKKHRARKMRKKASGSKDLAAQWDASGDARTSSKLQREEARITAWENLQKAKAEAAIRKLEMKLEKKRSASMDKILNKLRSGQSKAQEMRSSIAESEDHKPPAGKLKSRKFVERNYVRNFFLCCTRMPFP